MMPYVSSRQITVKPYFSSSNVSPTVLSHSLEYYLHTLKDQINDHSKLWDIYKKYTNPYECIHSCLNGTPPVCQLRPISRSFFKMIELCNLFDIHNQLTNEPIKSFHLAEGPGGFIEAFVGLRENPEDKYVGMTLLSEDCNVPGWKKSQQFLAKYPNVIIETGEDGTGNIMSETNLQKCARIYGASMDLVTADGGFDFSNDFNAQESQMSNLLYCQVVYATALQKQGGTFILKMFDIFSQISTDILYWLGIMYEKVHIVKLNTSRYANSERYVVAQGFRSIDGRKEWTIQVIQNFEKVCNSNIMRLFDVPIPRFFTSRIEDSNAVIGQQQMDTISSTLNLIRNPRQEKIEKLRTTNVQRCASWCAKNKMPFNRDIRQMNMFLSARNKVSRVPKKSPEIKASNNEINEVKLIVDEVVQDIENQQLCEVCLET